MPQDSPGIRVPAAQFLLLNRRRFHKPIPSVFLRTLITPGLRVPDGVLIEAVNIPWRMIAREMNRDAAFLHKIEPRQFEELVAASYHSNGFEVTLTPRSGDFGRDVIAVKHGLVSVKVLDSVKRYAPNHLVTADDVRALLGVLGGDHSVTNGVVTTSSDFAPKIGEDPIIKPYLPTRLKLVNGEQLFERIASLDKP
jgi:restriction system protein